MQCQLTVSIAVTSIENATHQIQNVAGAADVIELRLDYLKNIIISDIKQLLQKCSKPVIITIRSKQQGGHFNKSEGERLQALQQCMALQPDYLDLEVDVAAEQIDAIAALSTQTKLIRSSHCFANTPNDLDDLLQQLIHPSISIYKVITQAQSSLDALRMMIWVRQQSKQYAICGHCMGEDGIISRICGPVVGNYFLYCAADSKQAVLPHQISINDLTDIYHIQHKNTQSQLYALIGDPITKSSGHVFHNQYFTQHQINALYIKIRLDKKQLADFFAACERLPMRGISVTMPLKKAVLPFVNNQSAIEAVNTLRLEPQQITAINTDGIGALDALEGKQAVAGKKVLLIGAGGAANAIAAAAHARGARLSITNRTKQKAVELAKDYQADTIAIDQPTTEPFDIIINTIVDASYQTEPMQIWLASLLDHKPFVMDINYNQQNNQLKSICEKNKISYLSGESMFIQQAQAQLRYWLAKV